MRYLFYVSMMFMLNSCCELDEPPGPQQGLQPIYIPIEDLDVVSTQGANSFENPMDYTYFGDFILAMESHKGIYVVDNTDPTMPRQELFWNIPGVVSYKINGNILYADNAIDLLVIDVSEPRQIRLLTKVSTIYNGNKTALFPEDFFGFFECVDTTRGVVTGWEGTLLENPNCRR